VSHRSPDWIATARNRRPRGPELVVEHTGDTYARACESITGLSWG